MSDLEIRRYKAAMAELRAAGIYSVFGSEDRPSLWEKAFQSGRPFQYLSLRRNLLMAACVGITLGGPWIAMLGRLMQEPPAT